jgi:hypothetical protein
LRRKTSRPARGRPRGRPFAKGQSGNAATQWKPGDPSPNPAGPPRGMAAVREAQMPRLDAVMTRLYIIGMKKDNSAGVAALGEWLDREVGRAPQPITGADGGPLRVTYDVVRSKLEEIAKGAAAEAAGDAPPDADIGDTENDNDAGDEPPADPDPESA